MGGQATGQKATAEEAPPATTRPTGGRRSALDTLLRFREVSILLVAVALLLYFQSLNSAFLSGGNLRTLAQSIAATSIVAAGLVMILICGEIDLAVGATFGFTPIVMYLADQVFLLPVAIAIALVAAGLVGVVNGIFSVNLRVPSFVVTLGMFFFLTGINVVLTDGFPKPAPEESTLTSILGGHPYSGIAWAIVVIVLLQIVLKYTRWGLHTFATGGNLLGASEAGVKVKTIKIGNFVLASVLGGFAGILEAIRIDSIDPLGGGAETTFLAVAAAVIGGTALVGGVGTIIGAFLGTAVLAILRNGFTLQGVDASRFNVILGVAIVIAMTLNVYVARLRRSGRAPT